MKKILFMLPLMALMMVSCNKEDGDNGTTKQKLVKSISFVGEISAAFEYDDQQRLNRIIGYDSGGWGYNIEYGNNTITLIPVDSDGNVADGGFVYTFDNDGYLIELESLIRDDHYYKYNYTYKNGYLHTQTSHDGWGTTYSWFDGNMMGETSSGGRTYHYTYSDREYKENMNIFFLEQDSDWFVFSFKGIKSKNHPISYIGGGVNRYYYTYTFDEDGYVTKFIATKPDTEYYATYLIEYY